MIACRNVCVWSNYYNLICSSIQIFVATSQSYLLIPSKKEEHLGPVDDSYGMHGKRPQGLDTWEWNWYEGASVGETTSAGFNQTNCRCNNMNPLAEQISFSSLSPKSHRKNRALSLDPGHSETGKNDFKLLFFTRGWLVSECLWEMLAKKLSVYHSSYHLILSSKVKGFLKRMTVRDFHVQEWTLYLSLIGQQSLLINLLIG